MATAMTYDYVKARIITNKTLSLSMLVGLTNDINDPTAAAVDEVMLESVFDEAVDLFILNAGDQPYEDYSTDYQGVLNFMLSILWRDRNPKKESQYYKNALIAAGKAKQGVVQEGITDTEKSEQEFTQPNQLAKALPRKQKPTRS